MASHFARLIVGVKEEITDVGTLEHTVDVTPPAVFAWKVTVPGARRTTGVWTTVVEFDTCPDTGGGTSRRADTNTYRPW